MASDSTPCFASSKLEKLALRGRLLNVRNGKSIFLRTEQLHDLLSTQNIRPKLLELFKAHIAVNVCVQYRISSNFEEP
uniref:Uncharacterized protein n=1 Tax=Globodera rostochiensis TaxID=31243 RepID=A0A914HB19_GLORO